MKKAAFFTQAFALVSLFATLAFSQTAQLTGTVSDQSAGVVPGAKVGLFYVPNSNASLPTALAVDGQNNLLVAGAASTSAGNVVRKLRLDGTPVFAVSIAWKDAAGREFRGVPYAVTADPSGNAYVTGFTSVVGTNTIGPQPGFVAKLSPNGALLYTYLMPWGYGFGIAIDSSGQAYVAGVNPEAIGRRVPVDVTPGVAQSSYGGGLADGFVLKLDAKGSLSWATYLGGSGDDFATGIAVDASSGAVLVAGRTSGGFEARNPLSLPWAGAFGFVAKISNSGGTLEFATRLPQLGGTSFLTQGQPANSFWDRVLVAVDGEGNPYVAGTIRSSTLPASPGVWQSTFGGSSDVAVLKLNPAGDRLAWATYLGGGNAEAVRGIAIHSQGLVLAGNIGPAPDGAFRQDFPATPGFVQGSPGGGFVARLNATGTELSMSTGTSGLSGFGGVAGVALDRQETAYVGGWTNNPVFGEFARVPDSYAIGDVAIVRVTPPALFPARMRKAGGDLQTGLLGQRTGQPLMVEVTDSAGKPVPDMPIAFRGSRPTSPPTFATTDSEGRAGVSVTLDDGPGPLAFEAALPGLAQLTQTFTIFVNLPHSLRLPGGLNPEVSRYKIATIAGSPGRPFTTIGRPRGLVVDSSGTLYYLDTDEFALKKRLTDGTVSNVATTPGESLTVDSLGNFFVGVYAGNFIQKITPSGVVSEYVSVSRPSGLCIDPRGNLYVASQPNHVVYAIAPDKSITTFAGTGTIGFDGDLDKPAKQARLNNPGRLACDTKGNVYIADTLNNRVRRVSPDGMIRTVAGGGQNAQAPDGTDALAIQLGRALGVAVAPDGTLYINQQFNPRIWKIDALRIATNVSPGTALDRPFNMTVDATGALWVSDEGTRAAIYKLNSNGLLQAVLRKTDPPSGVPAAGSALKSPLDVTADSSQNLYVADTGTGTVRWVDRAGVIRTLAGDSAHPGTVRPYSVVAAQSGLYLYIGDENALLMRDQTGKLSTLQITIPAGLAGIHGLAVDARGRLHFVNHGRPTIQTNWRPGILRVSENRVQVLAGSQSLGYGGDGGPAVFATLSPAQGLAVDASGNVYFCDTGNHRVRRIDSSGMISTVAGDGTAGFGGDGGSAVRARVNSPSGIAVDGAGNVFIADTGNHRVRVITPQAIIFTVAGTGSPGFNGDGGAASSALLNSPHGVFVSAGGEVFIADTGNHAIRKLTRDPAPIEVSLTNGASFQTGPGAADALITLFGDNLTESIAVASGAAALPTSLAGFQVRVKDAAGVERFAPLYAVTPGQMSFLIPPSTAAGPATLTLTAPSGFSSTVGIRVETVAPGLFTAASSGRGAPAATVERVSGSGARASDLAFECDASGSCTPKPIVLGGTGDTTVLVLYGTGIRHRGSLSGVQAWVAEIPAEVQYAGVQSEALDQVNIILPKAAAGRGLADVILQVDGRTANPVWIDLQPSPRPPPPISWDFYTDAEGWSGQNLSGSRVTGGVWLVDPQGIDPYLPGPSISVSASDYKYVKVRMAVKCRGGGEIYFITAANNTYSEAQKVTFDPKPCPLCVSAPYQFYSIDMSVHPRWSRGTVITGIRLDPCAAGDPGTDADSVAIDYIRLSSTP